MNTKTIKSIFAGLILTGVIVTAGCGQKKPGGSGKDVRTARNVVDSKGKVSQLTSQITKLENDNKRLKAQRDAAEAKAQMVRVKVLNSPGDIIKELPGLYGSNDSAFQRRRIHLTESLVDSGEGSLDAIEEFLNSSQDTEPDIAADSHRRTLDRYGITDEQYVQLETNIKETLEVMKPTLDADKDRRDAERAERREADEKRRNEFRGKMEEFGKTLDPNLSREERGQKYREFFQQQREAGGPEREQREAQERKDRENREPSATDKLRAEVEANAKVIIGADQFETMQKDRSLGRMISEIGGDEYRQAMGGGGRGDWGRGRGGDQGRGGRPGGGR